MAVIKTLKGQTVLTVVCSIVYTEPEPPPPPDPDDTFIHQFYKMASAWRVVAFFLIVFVVPVILIVLPLYARYTLYPARSMALMADDTTDLHHMVSSFWCQGQRVNSNGTFDAYLLPKAPKLNKKRRKVTTVSSIMNISEDQPEAKMVHLLRGSSFTLGVCSRWPGGTVIVVQGRENYLRCYYTEDRDWNDVQEEQKRTTRIRMLTTTETPRRRRIPSRASKPPPQDTSISVLSVSDADVASDAESNGGEIFDDDSANQLDSDKNPTTMALGQTSKQVETTDQGTTKELTTSIPDGSSTMTSNRINFSTAQQTTESEQKLKLAATKRKEKGHKNGLESQNIVDNEGRQNGSKILRVLRSILGRKDVDDGSDEKTRLEAEETRKLVLLHSVNDTRDVTAGNSSMSSSEEFMENCKETILTVDVTPLVDCQLQDMAKGPKWTFSINQTDDYYFLFMSDNSIEKNIVNYFLNIDRVMYNVSNHVEACSNSSECSFPLSFMGSEAVVVEMAESSALLGNEEDLLSELESFEMQTVCQPRVAVYLVFILLVPFIILTFAFQ